MEGGEVGAQVAAPVFFHKGLPGQFHEAPKKRSFPWQNNPTGFHQAQVVGSNQPNSAGNWNPSSWNWDSIRFTARHVSDLSAGHGDQPDQRRRAEERSNTSPLRNNMVIDGGEGLTLNLGGGAYSGDRAIATSSPLPATRAPAPIPAPAVTATAPSQEPVARPNKRVRSGSPGSGGGGGSSSTGGGGVGASGGYPMCQVDDCRADLSSAKDYHRRHKVCEVHSKTTKALVGKQMQRFCQQCSRFHPLSEFDEGKRSCRRRLAGHNRRRRKTQPTDVASQLLLPGNQDGVSNANLNLVNILTALARLQGNSAEKSTSIPPTADRDGLIQIISKLSSLSGTNQPAKSPPSGGGFDLNTSEETHQDSVEQHTTNGVVNQAAPSTLNLLAVLSAASLAASAPNKPIFSNSQGSSDSSGNDKGKTQCVESPNDATKGFNGPIKGQSLNGPCLGLQLFGSSGDESPPKMGSTTTKYLSSESSNPMEEQSPSASPPITRKFFPIHSASEMATDSEAIRISDYKEDGMPVEMSTSRCQPFDLFKDMERRVNGKAVRNGASPVTYSSSAGSDHSPSTSNSDSQDRTGRIVFKLFGKDPSSFPQNIRNQINNWLSSSPTDMESYIRPGCVVLSVYLSMPVFAWDELEENLIQRVTSLVESSGSDFWKNGRFLVRTNRQLVSHKDGMIRLSKSWRTWSSPEVACVSPVAVVGGQKTSLVLRGRNLTVPGTKIYCTHMGKYLSKEVLCSTYPGTIYDDSSIEIFDFPGDEPPINLGRCFIEVENGFKGNSFPIIVASSAICQELRTLEVEFEERVTGDTNGEENGLQRSREDVLHFLNELGWLFQKEANSSSLSSDLIEFSVTRFKYLLVFSVERDWCVVTKTLLEMLTKMSLGNETLAQESLQTVGEMHLLNRAARRKCRKMVDMLLHFAVPLNNDGNTNNNSSKERKIYPFIPSLAGPNGWTPLHLAASSDAADEIIDALTDDPQQIGLSCWDTLLDESKQTPQMYAMARNKHSYNELVVRKRIDRKNGQVSISIDESEDGISMDQSVAAESRPPHPHAFQIKTPPPTSCAQCAMMEAVPCIRPTRRGGLLARPYVLSMLGIAAVCVCVCLFMRGRLRINYGRSFKWENLDYGPF